LKKEESDAHKRKSPTSNFGDMLNLIILLARTDHPMAKQQPDCIQPFLNTTEDIH